MVCAALLLASGCGGQQRGKPADGRQLQLTINQLRAEARRERARVHDLENQLLLLQDRLETAQLAGRGGAAEPRLPVEVLEPAPADAAGDPDHLVVGVDDEGTQIVYEGDAARPTSVSPPMTYADDELPPDRGAPRRPYVDEPVIVGAAGDRIPVTGSVPSIDAQLRAARTGRRPVAIESTDAEALYHRHQAALAAGRHAEAIAGFRDFVARYPTHDFADNARYWLGEAFYDQKDYRQAMSEFRKVVKDYPRGNKVPDALLKVGYCYAALGETAKARDVLGQVVAIYPTSGPARLAAHKLDELSAKGHP